MTQHSKPKLVKCASFPVFVDAMISFENLIGRKKFFNVSKDIKEEDFKPPQVYKRQIDLVFYRLINLPPNTMASTEEVLSLIRHTDHRPAHLWEGLSQENERMKEHQDHLVMFLGKTVGEGDNCRAPGIRFDLGRPMLNLYGLARHWKESDLFVATVPDKYIYPPLF